MRFASTTIEGLYLVESDLHTDPRGMFARLLCERELREIGHSRPIVQINHSRTVSPGALRGMHFQYPPYAEIKMVRCLRGAAFDVAVDLRKGSRSFLRWHGEILTAENMRMMYIPEGFAHGFQTLEPETELLYFHTAFYSPEHEGGVRHDDPAVGISWPMAVSEMSDRDRNHPLLGHGFDGIKV